MAIVAGRPAELGDRLEQRRAAARAAEDPIGVVDARAAVDRDLSAARVPGHGQHWVM